MLQFRTTMAGEKSIMDSLYGFMSQFVKMCLPVSIIFSLGKKLMFKLLWAIIEILSQATTQIGKVFGRGRFSKRNCSHFKNNLCCTA